MPHEDPPRYRACLGPPDRAAGNRAAAAEGEAVCNERGAARAGEPDLCNYRIDAAAARAVGLLDERPGEDIASTIRRYAAGLPVNRFR